jgi:hypothetical protein
MVIASITTAAARPTYAGFDHALPFLPSVVPATGVTPRVWPLAGPVVPMPTRFAVNQTSPPREVVPR